MKLDIIIPAYNAHDTIDITLNSIMNQKEIDDFQVILVNDCSNHDYSEFVKKYSIYFPIQEVKTKVNGGPGVARNVGMENSSSPYIVFIDSDDYFVGEFALIHLYNKIVETNSDLVIGDFIYERDQERLVKTHNYVWLHGKIFKRAFLENHHISFNNSRANEDNGFVRLIFLLNAKIEFLEEVTYCYHENPNSITRRNNRLYGFTGLEGFSYNMCWALEEALKRGADKHFLVSNTMNFLVTMYFYYMEYDGKYDIEKIINWSKNLLDFYERFPDYQLTNDTIQFFVNIKRQQYIDSNTPYHDFLSIHEFIQKIKDR